MTQLEPLTDLSGLAARAKDEYRLAGDAMVGAVAHAIACGDALLAAQAQVPEGKWGAWCRENVPEIDPSRVTKLCRLAAHKDVIIAGNFATIERAMAYMRSLSIPPRPSGPRRGKRQFDRDEAKRLHNAGVDYKTIGEMLGVSDQTVSLVLNPARSRKKAEYQKRYLRERQAAAKAKEREDRDRAVRLTKGLPAEAYALLRQCALVVDKAIGESADASSRANLRAALGFVHKAEDEIVRALKLERTTA
jgi:hypothetical protein